jgi:UDP-N-acetylglucosamine--N-acetylmuramyl-(pentapeptide) pyrophosphoryl-undecaprenol N-acetylglucosamine transferase
MKILITGGHYSTALAIIDKLKNQSIVFVGREYAVNNDIEKSLEYKEIIKRDIKFISLNTGKISRELSFKAISQLFKIPQGFVNAFKIINKEKPDVVLSFGSYMAVPICFASWIFKIPVFIHEQTIKPGLSNQILSLLSKKVFVSFPQALKYFPDNKSILTGNPVRNSLFYPAKQFDIEKNLPVLFITGGSLGSHSINNIIKKNIKYLLKKYIVILQTGSAREFDDFTSFEKIKKTLPDSLRKNLYIKKNFIDKEMAFIYSVADLVLSRSGANTVFELIVLRKPCILIPLPWAVRNEQEEHAKILKKAGVCEIFYQNENEKKLLRTIDNMIKNIETYKNNFKNISYLNRKNAAEEIIKAISIH